MISTNCVKRLFGFKRNIFRFAYCINFVRYRSEGTKVVLLNSYSDIGIWTAYLLKKTYLYSEICIHDHSNVQAMEGTAADLNNISTPSSVTFCKGKTSITEALSNANIVIMLEKKKTTKEDESCEKKESLCKTQLEIAATILHKAFMVNAEQCATLAESYARICPTALLVVAMNPVNSTLPLVCKVARKINHNVTIQKILGFMTPDVIRANLLWAKLSKMKMENTKVPVVGGSSAYTAIPLFSQMKHPENEPNKAEGEKLNAVLQKLTEDVRKKNELNLLNPNAPLATAAAISKFVIALGTAIKGDELKEHAYIQSNLIPSVSYIGGPVQIGPAGVQQILPLPNISNYEKLLLESAPYYLKSDIKRGEDYAETYLSRNIECK